MTNHVTLWLTWQKQRISHLGYIILGSYTWAWADWRLLSGLMLGLRSANERRCYFVWRLSLAGRRPRFPPSQWETSLLCNGASHWLDANLESTLAMIWCTLLPTDTAVANTITLRKRYNIFRLLCSVNLVVTDGMECIWRQIINSHQNDWCMSVSACKEHSNGMTMLNVCSS